MEKKQPSRTRRYLLVALSAVPVALVWGFISDRSPDGGTLDWSAFAGRLVFMPAFLVSWYIVWDWLLGRRENGE